MAFRGRGSSRGRGRGRGGGARGGRGSSRGGRNIRARSGARAPREGIQEEPFEEPVVADDDDEDQEQHSELDISSGEESEDLAAGDSRLPYSSLLQALSSSAQRGEPQRKKRRVDSAPGHADQISQNHLASDTESKTVSGHVEGSDLEIDGPEDSAEENVSDISDDDEPKDDPFEKHFMGVEVDYINAALRKDHSLSWPEQSGKLTGGWKYVSARPVLPVPSTAQPLRSSYRTSDMHLKQKLHKAPNGNLPSLAGASAHLAGPIFGYQDVLSTDRAAADSHELRKLYCTHAVNHVLKTRDKVIKNNARLAKIEDDEDEKDDDKFRDQGFTRPRVLFLLPTRQACSQAVDAMMSVLQPEQQENRKRFKESFSDADDLTESDKPEDFKELFGGNDDDRFLLGLKLTRKTVKFFASFYTSDIIFASPLGLHAKITSDDKKKRDWDFLSSIEIVIVDQADALIMQNWENVETVFEHLNLEPKQSHGSDFARARKLYLDKCAKYYRQTLVFSAYSAPELNALFKRSMLNIAGRHKFRKDQYNGAITRLGLQVKQTFVRFETTSPSADPEARFKYFTTSVLPILAKHARSGAGKLQGTLIFIPSYMDFLRVQNFFCYSSETQGIMFDEYDLPCISEYASKQQNARARSLFQSGKHNILLYTGRAHHFYRYKLRGVKRVIMYSLPENPAFYEELVGEALAKSVSEGKFSPDEISALSMFSKYDALKLERVVGTSRYPALLREKGDIFEFNY